MNLSFYIENYLTEETLQEAVLGKIGELLLPHKKRIMAKITLDLLELWVKEKVFKNNPPKNSKEILLQTRHKFPHLLHAAGILGFHDLKEEYLPEEEPPKSTKNSISIYFNRVILELQRQTLKVDRKEAIDMLVSRAKEYKIIKEYKPSQTEEIRIKKAINDAVDSIITETGLNDILPKLKELLIVEIVGAINKAFDMILAGEGVVKKSSSHLSANYIKEDLFLTWLKANASKIFGEVKEVKQHPNKVGQYPDFSVTLKNGKIIYIDSKGEKLKGPQLDVGISLMGDSITQTTKDMLIKGYNGTIPLTYKQVYDIFEDFKMPRNIEHYIYSTEADKKDIFYRRSELSPDDEKPDLIKMGTSTISNIRAKRSKDSALDKPSYWIEADFHGKKGATRKTLFRLEFRGNILEALKNNKDRFISKNPHLAKEVEEIVPKEATKETSSKPSVRISRKKNVQIK